MQLISLFDGIGGFPLAFCNVFGIDPGKFNYYSSEIEPWPCEVVRQRFPKVVELGSVMDIQGNGNDRLRAINNSRTNEGGDEQAIGCGLDTAGKQQQDEFIITFGSPCQDLSIAGKRAGLDGERSGLFHEAIRLVRELRPKYAIWENVKGAYSSNEGHDFATVLQCFAEVGYDAAWTCFDAQWFGVPQRRRRIYLLACRDGIPNGADPFAFVGRSTRECARKIQLVSESRKRNPASSKEAGQAVAGPIGSCAKDGCKQDLDTHGAYVSNGLAEYKEADVAAPTRAQGGDCGGGSETVVSGTIDASFATKQGLDNQSVDNGLPLHVMLENHGQDSRIKKQDTAPTLSRKMDTGGNNVPLAFSAGQGEKAGSIGAGENVTPTLKGCASGTNQVPTIAFDSKQSGEGGDVSPPLRAMNAENSNQNAGGQVAITGPTIRRLTPLECLRLQGFPDGWFDDVPNYSDSKAYKAIGNSLAVACAETVFKAIMELDKA